MPGVTTAYQAGVHGSRPAANAGCILYSCSTHGLVYRSDGSSWTTWLTLPSGVSSATPALTFGTAAAQGAASTYVATDATLPIFDATAPSTQAFGDAAAAGSAGVAARRDHKHAMPAYPIPWVIPADMPTYHNSNGVFGAANRCVFHTIRIPVACTINGVRISIGVSSGNISVALYDSTRTRVATSGAVASPGTGQRTISFTSGYAAAPGQYYLALSADNTTISFSMGDDNSSLRSPFSNPQYKASAHPAPAGPVTFDGATSNMPILIAVVNGGYPS